MIGLLQTNILRPADVNFQGLVHVYLGLFQWSCDARADHRLIKREDEETVIFELEGLAFATALNLFGTLIREKKVVVFTCNQSVQSSVSQTTTTWISSFAQYAPWKNSSDYGSSVCHPSQTLLMSSLERDLWDFVVWCPWLWTWKPCGASAWRRECAVPPVCGSDARHKRQDSMVCPVVKKNEHIVCSEFMSFATCSLNAAAWEIRCNPTCWWNIIS
jgi:hypothetical protein